MRILFVSNNKTERCGVAEWGRHCVAALRKNGHEVLDWHYPSEPHPPAEIEEGPAEVVFINWHAGTIGGVDLERLRFLGNVQSAYLHESSPAWNEREHRPPLLDQVDVAFVDHPAVEKAIYFRTPVWDVVPEPSRDSGWLTGPWIGATGIRGEGHDAIVALARNRGWRWYFSSAYKWLSPREEVNRLSNCWINVAWYGAGFGGQASAMGALIAAGQPILINSNRMLETWRDFAEPKVIQWTDKVVPPQLYLSDDLEAGLLEILADIRDGKARRPTWLREAYKWPKQAERMVEAWERRLR